MRWIRRWLLVAAVAVATTAPAVASAVASEHAGHPPHQEAEGEGLSRWWFVVATTVIGVVLYAALMEPLVQVRKWVERKIVLRVYVLVFGPLSQRAWKWAGPHYGCEYRIEDCGPRPYLIGVMQIAATPHEDWDVAVVKVTRDPADDESDPEPNLVGGQAFKVSLTKFDTVKGTATGVLQCNSNGHDVGTFAMVPADTVNRYRVTLTFFGSKPTTVSIVFRKCD